MDGKFTFVDHRVINLMGYTPVNSDHHHYSDDHHEDLNEHSYMINLFGYLEKNLIKTQSVV